MNLFSQVITDENDIYIYFEIIRQLEPQSVLDAGMMLKRIGAVSRQAMHCEIPVGTRLDGIDGDPEIDLPVYRQIYSNIYLVGQMPEQQYDLVVLLAASNIISENSLNWIGCHGKRALFDVDDLGCRDFFVSRYECQALRLEGKTYGLAVITQ